MAYTPAHRSAPTACALACRLILAAGLAASVGASASGALVVSTWASAQAGAWNNAAFWSPNANFPNNGTPVGDTYHAIIDATGVDYIVTLSTPVTLDMLTLNSANATLNHIGGSFNPGVANISAGVYRMSGGTISGGTWNITGAGVFDVSSSSSNAITNATINGDLVLSVGSARAKVTGSTRFGTARLQSNATSLGFAPGYTLLDDVIAEGAAAGIRLIEMNGSAGTFTVGASGSITHAAGTGGDFVIGGSQWFGGAMTLVNDGLISMEAAGRTMTIGAATWSNTGTVQVSDGTLNLGAFNTTGGIGSWIRTGGTVNINAALNNAASSFTLNNSTGSWTLNGGSINGGSVNFGGSAQLLIAANSANILTDVDLNGDVTLAVGSARTRVTGATRFDALRLQNNATSLSVVPGYTLLDDVIAEGAAAGIRLIEMNGSAGTFTVGASGSITHAAGAGGDFVVGGSQWFGGAMTLVNDGLISMEAAGRTMTIGAATWSNTGTVHVSDGTLNLGLLNTTGGIGSWIRTGGTVNINAALNNAASSFTLNNSTGSWTLNGGSINGGSVNFGGSAQLLIAANNSNILTDVDINGDVILSTGSARTRVTGATRFDALRLQNNATSLSVAPGYTLLDDVIAEGAAAGIRLIEMNGSAGTFTVGASGSITHAAGAGGDFVVGGSQWFGGAMTLVNDGLISMEAAGRTMTIGAATWSNTGTVHVSDGTLNLGLLNTTGGIGSWIRTGGTVNINAALNNAASSFTLNNSTGSWTLNGGSINGGSVNFGGSAQLLIAANNSNILTDVDINGDVILSTGSARTRVTGATRFDALRLQNNATSLSVAPGYTLLDDVIAEGAAAGTRLIEMNGSAGTFTVGASGSITHAAGTGGDFVIGGSQWFGGAMTLVNDGLISMEAAGRTMTIGAATWSNTGTVQVSDGTLNLGAFNTTGGIGSWIRTGGTVNINAALNNAASSFTLNNSTGSWTLNGGSINGGSVNFGGSAQLLIAANNSNILTDVDINGDVILSTGSARTRVTGATRFDALRLQNNATSLSVAPGYTLLDDVIAEGAAAGIRLIEMNGSAGTFTVGASGSITHAAGTAGDFVVGGSQWFGGAMTLVNNGAIRAQASGRTTTIVAQSFDNQGEMEARGGGTLSIDTVGATAFVNNGPITAGTGGTVRFVDGYNTASSTGDLTVEIGGALVANYGRINVTGATAIDGADIELDFVNGFAADWGDKFTVLTSNAGQVTGDFSTFVLPTLTDAVNWRWYSEQTTTAVSVGVRHTSDINRDNSINFADLNIIVSNFNSNGSAAMGDVDGDGFIGFADLNRVLSFFNTSAPINTVPAPGGVALLAGLLGASLRRRR